MLLIITWGKLHSVLFTNTMMLLLTHNPCANSGALTKLQLRGSKY